MKWRARNHHYHHHYKIHQKATGDLALAVPSAGAHSCEKESMHYV